MSNKIFIEKRWISVEKATFKETQDPKTGKKNIYIEALIVPFNKISRNGVLYNKETIIKSKDQIIGKPLHHNHDTDGKDNFPRGEWIESWVADEGLYGKAKVYNTSYNKDYIEWLQESSGLQVSLQVSGEAEQVKNDDDKYYQQAYVTDWLEISTVNIPGFLEARGSMEAVLCEAFKPKTQDNFFEKLLNVRNKYLEI